MNASANCSALARCARSAAKSLSGVARANQRAVQAPIGCSSMSLLSFDDASLRASQASQRMATLRANGPALRARHARSMSSASANTPFPPRHVLKFGGSSVGNADAFRNVADVVLAHRDAGNRVVTVLSAMLGVTNRLIESARAVANGDLPTMRTARAELIDLHASTVQELVGDGPFRDDAMAYIQSTFKTFFDDVCEEVSADGGVSAYAQDRISSVGERWSTRIMAAYLTERGIDAPFVESDQLIVTDDVSGNAKPVLDASRACVQSVLVPMLHRGALPIVTGFFGASTSGKLTTLGRGGSDLTAAVLGYCLDAAEVSLWKVEYTTDAKGRMDKWVRGWEGVVHDAEPSSTIQSLAYEEAAELAHFGKKVLHPETVMPAVVKGIPISVRNTINPEHPGTRIEWYGGASNSARLQAVTRLPLKAYEDKNAQLSDLDLAALRVKREEASIVALVGLNVMSIPGLEATVRDMLFSAGIPTHVPQRVNGSSNNFSVVVPESRRNEAVKLLHEKLVKLHRAAQAAAPAPAASKSMPVQVRARPEVAMSMVSSHA